MLIRAYTSIIAACLVWSLNPAAIKLALEEIAVPQLVFMRAVFAAFIMLLVSFFMGYRFRLKEIGWRPFLLGVLDPGLPSLLFVTSLTVLSATNTVLILALVPFSQSVLGRVVFKEELRSSVWSGGTLAFSGIVIYFSGEAFNGADTVCGNSLLLSVFCLLTIKSITDKENNEN